MDYKNINSILNEKLKAFCNENGYDVSWEDIPYDPVVDTLYLEQFFLPGQGVPYRNGDKEQGLYQVNVNVSVGNGRGIALEIIDAVRLYFGRILTATGKGRVAIVQSFLSTPQTDQSWYTEILNFQWEAM